MRDAYEPDSRPDAAGAGAAGADAVGAAGGWQGVDATARACRAVAAIQAEVEELLAALQEEPLAASAVLEITTELGHVVNQLRAAHTLTIGQARSSGMWALHGYPTSTAWLRDTHLLDGGRARAQELTATWLDEHTATKDAFTSGRVSAEHITAIRRTTATTPRRARAYRQFETDLLNVAANSDPKQTVAVLKAWADAVDATDADNESANNTNRRAFYCSPIADGWDLRGYLPGPEGAELAGVLNAIMEQRRRDSSDDALNPPATRRADALLDLARATSKHPNPQPHSPANPNTNTTGNPNNTANPRTNTTGNPNSTANPRTNPNSTANPRTNTNLAGSPSGPSTGPTTETGLIGPGGRHRARIIVTVPFTRLVDTQPDDPPDLPPHAKPNDPPDLQPHAKTGEPPDHNHPSALPDIPADPVLAAGTWRCGNGPGDGFLAMRDILRLACDGEIQRLVLDADSMPLNLGRANRVVPPHLRTALEIRDRGCIMPGCQRPPSWCEAHHIHHWADGGRTDLQNLALLCSRHHHELHNGIWTITSTTNGPPTAKRKGIPHTRPTRLKRL